VRSWNCEPSQAHRRLSTPAAAALATRAQRLGSNPPVAGREGRAEEPEPVETDPHVEELLK
jgi:hypothetical protein